MARRGPIELKLEILETAQTPIKPTRLMYATMSSYPVIIKYTARLIDQGFLERILPPPPKRGQRNPDGKIKYLFHTTPLGLEAINRYKTLVELLT